MVVTKRFFLLFLLILNCFYHQAFAQAFGFDNVVDRAKALSKADYQAPPKAPEALLELDYPKYESIRYQGAIWAKSSGNFTLQPFPPGYLFTHPVEINIIENGVSRPLQVTDESFTTEDAALKETLVKLSKFSGFRITYPINSKKRNEEFAVFQGASYFRGISKGQFYGLSHRGLAIDVGQPHGEEFPMFTHFWIERPASSQHAIVVYALLNSESITGAYRFGIYPGNPTFMDVGLQLFPRKALKNVGIAPLTSMYMHNPLTPSRFADYRPAVHDSEALTISTKEGERIWRPLNNPKILQFSAFAVHSPNGFGLIQRNRTFNNYQDLDLLYEKRPSAWISPQGDWGEGEVVLVEIPSDSENNDNIVSYWHPKYPLKSGQTYQYDYRLTWPDDIAISPVKAKVVRSAANARLVEGGKRDREFMIDYQGLTPDQIKTLTVDATLSEGKILEKRIQVHPAIEQGARLFIRFDPQGADMSEMRVQLMLDQQPLSETWLYRWLKDNE